MHVVIVQYEDRGVWGRDEGVAGGVEVGVIDYDGWDGVEDWEGGLGEEGEGVVLGNEGAEGAEAGLGKGAIVCCCFSGGVCELAGG